MSPKPLRLSSDDEETVVACPECDKAGDVYQRRGSNTHIGNPDDPLACGKCSATFEEPNVREKKPKGPQAEAIRKVREAFGEPEGGE